MIAAILERHGLRSGAYLSPHLVSFTERVRVAERDIAPQEFAEAARRACRAAAAVDRTLTGGEHVTQFEALTSTAYLALRDAGVEVAVIEAGLGGRFDATNVIDSRGPGADGCGSRAHSLARSHDQGHRDREGGRRQARRDARRRARPRATKRSTSRGASAPSAAPGS